MCSSLLIEFLLKYILLFSEFLNQMSLYVEVISDTFLSVYPWYGVCLF